MTVKLEVKNLIKIFGAPPQKALKLLRQGMSKDRILAETGQTVAVNNVSFSVNTGEVFVIMGLSGSGKSTVLRCINRLIEPSSGEVYMDGRNLTALNSKELRNVRQKTMAMVFQQFALLPHRTVLQNTVYGLEVQGIAKAEREKRAERYLETVGLSDWKNAYPDDLSGGMKQRVGLARALTCDTDVLLMDEAFSALDPLIRTELQEELINLQKQVNKTIVFITHDFNEAMRLGDRIVFLKDGAVAQIGTPEQIVSKPADEYVAKFVRGIAAIRGDRPDV